MIDLNIVEMGMLVTNSLSVSKVSFKKIRDQYPKVI